MLVFSPDYVIPAQTLQNLNNNLLRLLVLLLLVMLHHDLQSLRVQLQLLEQLPHEREDLE